MKINPLSIIYAFVIVASLTNCANNNNKPKVVENTPKTENTVTPPIVGNDKDEHGCMASAGYNWSPLRNECIRIFEAGIRLEPQLDGLDKSLSAFVIFKQNKEDDALVEIYLPTEKAPISLTKTKKQDAGEWNAGNWKLTQWKGMYMLEKSGVLHYQGHL